MTCKEKKDVKSAWTKDKTYQINTDMYIILWDGKSLKLLIWQRMFDWSPYRCITENKPLVKNLSFTWLLYKSTFYNLVFDPIIQMCLIHTTHTQFAHTTSPILFIVTTYIHFKLCLLCPNSLFGPWRNFQCVHINWHCRIFKSTLCSTSTPQY